MILDNRSMAPIADSDVRNFMPLFALDQEGVKLFAAPYVERTIDASEAPFVPAASDTAGSGGPGTLPRLS
jgi:hypothetical protein